MKKEVRKEALKEGMKMEDVPAERRMKLMVQREKRERSFKERNGISKGQTEEKEDDGGQKEIKKGVRNFRGHLSLIILP